MQSFLLSSTGWLFFVTLILEWVLLGHWIRVAFLSGLPVLKVKIIPANIDDINAEFVREKFKQPLVGKLVFENGRDNEILFRENYFQMMSFAPVIHGYVNRLGGDCFLFARLKWSIVFFYMYMLVGMTIFSIYHITNSSVSDWWFFPVLLCGVVTSYVYIVFVVQRKRFQRIADILNGVAMK